MRQFSHFLLIIVAFLCSGAAVSAPPACSTVPAGVVVDYAGRSSDYEFLRAGRPIAFGLYSEVREGDRLRVASSGGRISLSAADGSITTVKPAHGRVCVARGSIPWWGSNAWKLVGDLFTASRNRMRDLVTRDGKLALAPPDLAGGTAKVTAGRRNIALAWNGGLGPFSVEVEGPAGTLVSETGVKAGILRLRDPRDIVPGRHRVAVRDRLGNVVTGQFEAVEGKLPPEPGTAAEALAVAGEILASGADRRLDAFMYLSPRRVPEETIAEVMDMLVEPAR